MKNIPARARLLHVLVVMLVVLFCQIGVAQAAVVPDDPEYTTITADPNISSTCSNDVVYEQYNATGSVQQRVEKALQNNQDDGDIVNRAAKFNEGVRNIWFCPIKITAMTSLVTAASTIAAGIMAALIAAITALITTLITDIINSICQALLGAITGALAGLLCIPPLNINLKMPKFSFRGGGSTGSPCSGVPLITVTGGPPLPTPPLSYGASLPGTNWQGRVNVIK